MASAVEAFELGELFLILRETAAVEVAASLVLLALQRLLVLADHRRRLPQLVVDVLQLVDHAIARLRREVDLPQLVGQLDLELLNRLLRRLQRPLRQLALFEGVAHRQLDLALRGDADGLQVFADVHVEAVFVHLILRSPGLHAGTE